MIFGQIIPEYHYWRCRITKILSWPETVYPSPEYLKKIFFVVIIAHYTVKILNTIFILIHYPVPTHIHMFS
jgi:hypothetical protein